MKKLLLIGMAMLLLNAAAFAYSTGQGPTGLVCVPTADAVPAGNLEFSADLFYPPSSGGVKMPNCYPFRLEYGVAKNWEVGAAFVYQKGLNQDAVNAKWVMPWTVAGSKLAIGGQFIAFAKYAGATSRMTDENLYLAVTRPLYANKNLMLIGDLGLAYDNLNNWLGPNSTNILRPMAGAVLVLPTLHNVAICADFIPKDSATGVLDASGKSHDTFSMAAVYPINKMCAVDAGFTTGTPFANAGSVKANLLVGFRLKFSSR